MYFEFNSDPEHIRRERRKAQELRKSSWWKQQIGPGRCHHCGERFAKELLTMDHTLPLARGGKTSKKNCVPSCKACNSERGALFNVERVFIELEAERRPVLEAERSSDLEAERRPVLEAERSSDLEM